LAAALDELDEARETIRQLRDTLKEHSGVLYEGISFTRDESIIVGLLVGATGVVQMSTFLDHLDLAYDHGISHTNLHLRVIICRLRPKLRPHGILIENRPKRGYAMSPENKDKLMARRRV
jgi:DNA-binding response OmpR family regulator